MAVILTLSDAEPAEAEPKGKDPCICFLRARLTSLANTHDAVIPSGAAQRRSRGTPAFSLAFLYLVAGLPQLAVAQGGSSPTIQTETAQATKPFTFEVVSIRPHPPGSQMEREYLPDGYKLYGMSIGSIIGLAYTPADGYVNLSSEIRNAPAWLFTDKYDIDARVAQEDQQAWQKAVDRDEIDSPLAHSALLAALQERAKLAVHITSDQKPCLDLVVGSHGAKLKPTVPGEVKVVPGKTSKLGDGFDIQQDGSERFVGVSMTGLASRLVRAAGGQTLIQDKTGLSERYDFTLPFYAQDPDGTGLDRMPVSSIGLALKQGKAPITVVNIDHIQKPDPN